MTDESKTKDGRLALALVLLCLLSLVIVIAILNHPTGSRLSGDFWPPDRSFVGPNLLASIIQWAGVAVVLTLLYPPLRHLAEQFLHKHVTAPLKEHFTSEARLLHAKVDHIIEHHPDIPAFEPKEK